MQKSVGVRRCRLVPVLRAETSTVENVEICVWGKSVCVCVCRLVPVLRTETNTLKIVEMRVGRLVPILTYNVNNNATENVKGEMTGVSFQLFFKGRNENAEIRGCA